MINSSHLNKLLYFTLFFITLILNTTITVAAVDIWEKKEKKNEQENQIDFEENTIIKSPILSDNTNKISTNISESEIDKSEQTMLGLFDPEVNNFTARNDDLDGQQPHPDQYPDPPIHFRSPSVSQCPSADPTREDVNLEYYESTNNLSRCRSPTCHRAPRKHGAP